MPGLRLSCTMPASPTNGDITSSPSTRPRMARSAAPCSRSEEHTSELQSLMRISYAVFCLKKKKNENTKKRSKYVAMSHEIRAETSTNEKKKTHKSVNRQVNKNE